MHTQCPPKEIGSSVMATFETATLSPYITVRPSQPGPCTACVDHIFRAAAEGTTASAGRGCMLLPAAWRVMRCAISFGIMKVKTQSGLWKFVSKIRDQTWSHISARAILERGSHFARGGGGWTTRPVESEPRLTIGADDSRGRGLGGSARSLFARRRAWTRV